MKNIILVFSFILAFSANASIKWEKIHSENNIDIFSRNSKSGILPFRATGKISAPLKTVLNALMDLPNKSKWSPKLKQVKIHEVLNSNEMIISEYYKTPWPATDREFLLKGKLEKISDSKYTIKAHSINNHKYASKSHIQSAVEYLDVTIEDLGDNTTSIDFKFHGDFKGWMPVWLTNLIQKKWPLRFIQGLDSFLAEKV